ncbi:hypothetical protein FEZ08_03985 [Culicoidibacter larvae]|uniref:Uncharacterized protein n=2 Tax=Culicoidibacter larvae TaxID=2579976 RepID=A0A5R8QFK0_9FIRM|nr:hypothetical protein [Culicoidibacter larvae]TLG76785.1 hypothetical protein FEZ08_03985 [Culicoidibacter larvae]
METCTYCGNYLDIDLNEIKKYPSKRLLQWYLKSNMYGEALPIYHQLLTESPSNDVLWGEYLVFLLDYCEQKNYANFSMILHSTAQILIYCKANNLFVEFSKPELLIDYYQRITNLLMKHGIFKMSSYNLDVSSISKTFMEVERSFTTRKVAVNTYDIIIIRLMLTCFMNDVDTKRLLAISGPKHGIKEAYFIEQLFGGEKSLDNATTNEVNNESRNDFLMMLYKLLMIAWFVVALLTLIRYIQLSPQAYGNLQYTLMIIILITGTLGSMAFALMEFFVSRIFSKYRTFFIILETVFALAGVLTAFVYIPALLCEILSKELYSNNKMKENILETKRKQITETYQNGKCTRYDVIKTIL